ncbi:MAG: beta-ketoadipyl CoA thiolase [Chloroflexi bacterium]|nr:beta-ketoadipyl CoA thiolase [Chloroflexota bacterium]
MAKPSGAFPRGKIEMEDSTLGWRFINPRLAERYEPISLGETAENVAERYEVNRQRQDQFALASQQKAGAAIRDGRFNDEIVPVLVPQPRGAEPRAFDTDEHPRPDTTIEALAKLQPAFKKGGTVTAGNSSGVNDGASALLIMSEERAHALGLEPLATCVASSAAGVNPLFMGVGPIPATRKLFERTGVTADDLDLIELNEAFASQSIVCIDELKLPKDRVNVNGGAIALGHPLGCSGAKLTTTLVHEMRRRSAQYGMVSMCVGVGQGVSTLFERGG